MIHIRTARADEWRQMKALRCRALKDAPEAFMETLEGAENAPDELWQNRARANAEGETSTCAVAQKGDDSQEDAPLVGMAVGAVDPNRPGVAFLYALWVQKDERTKGLATRLVDAIEQWARRKGARSLYTQIRPANEPAHRFFKKIGFQEPADPSRAQHNAQPDPDDPCAKEGCLLLERPIAPR